LHFSHIGGSRFWFWPDFGNEIFSNGNCRYGKFVVTRAVKSHVKTWVSILRSEQSENKEKQKNCSEERMVNPTGEVMGVRAS
jgi:hypothetical protein